MKRICSVFAAIITLFSVFGFSGCGENKEKIKLSPDNYFEYLSVNKIIEDYDIAYNPTTDKWYCSLVVTMETSPKTNCVFENGWIRFYFKDLDPWYSFSISVNLPRDGRARSSYIVTAIMFLPFPENLNFDYSEISATGNVWLI